MIFVPKVKELILPITVRAKVHGRFKVYTKEEGKPMRLRAEFDNLVTNNGLDLLCGGGNYMAGCAVGTGNATPLVTNTALQSLVAFTTTTVSTSRGAQSSSPYYGSTIFTYSFATGAAAGNLAEVGVGATSTSLMSRALILNGGGSPTTITVLSSEALYVTYQLNQIVPLTDVTGSATIGGSSYSYTLRAANATSTAWALNGSETPNLDYCNAFNGSIGAITGTPSGTSAGADSGSTATYTPGSYTLNYTAGWSITAGNLSGGITAFDFGLGGAQSRGVFQIGLGTAIPKTGSNVLTINFSTVWSR